MPYFPISVKLVKIVPTKVGLSGARQPFTLYNEDKGHRNSAMALVHLR